MDTLIIFVAFLLYFSGGFIALTLTILILLAAGVYTFKAIRLLIALLNYAITEPESKIIAKVQRLSKIIAKKPAIRQGDKMLRPEPWPKPPRIQSKNKK
jgi:hypothetical protein